MCRDKPCQCKRHEEGYKATERVFAELQTDAATLHGSIRQHLERNFAPDASKHLRTFSSSEAAEFLGLAPGHLRKLYAEGKVPDVPLNERGRKFYSAQDLGPIRLAFARATRDPALYLRGRVGQDPLQIISCVSFKGGSAKTTTAAYLASGLRCMATGCWWWIWTRKPRCRR